MNELFYVVMLPLVGGIFLFILPERTRVIKGIITALIALVVVYYCYLIFRGHSSSLVAVPFANLLSTQPQINQIFTFNMDKLSRTILLFIGFFSIMLALYSLSYIGRGRRPGHYYSYYLITIGSSCGAVLADNFLLFITFWGVLGFTLYKLIGKENEASAAAAKKSFILIGASDSVMIFGIGILWVLTKTMRMSDISVETTGPLAVIAFVSLLIGSLTKAGAFPVHTWVPDYTANAPASSSALLPASLDKLLGIYLLARICMSLFQLNQWLRLTLLIIGVITIIAAVMMALVQHNFKKLLGYHAVSQVGYMVVGLGLGTPIGIAGGLFHMINNALYKGGLFLTAGSVEKRTGTDELDEVGGLASVMPITFISALICALSISGIPPFNGFASKWLIYQAIIEFGKGVGPAQMVWPIWLVLAVFGSALTLASFIKFISGIYLGRKNEKYSKVHEVSILMWLPEIIIALVCLGFGIVATKVVIPFLIKPLSGDFNYSGIWGSNIVTGLIVISIVIGFIIYLLGNIKKIRVTGAFAGGEEVTPGLNYSPGDFYKTIRTARLLSCFYNRAEKGKFDIYDNSKGIILTLNRLFSACHPGILPLYTLWIVLGMIILMVILLL